MQISFSIYLASKTRWAHLQKDVDLPAIPRPGEYVKLRNWTRRSVLDPLTGQKVTHP